jgi:hypothetical protein
VWQGQRAEGLVLLEGPTGQLQLDQRQATWLTADGSQLGTLGRIARRSGMLGAEPPPGATILFDGHDVAAFQKATVTPDGLLAAGATTKEPFGDFRLHLEFRTPYMPRARGQGRGNSGVYIQERYEVQILDSFGLPTTIDGCGALYKQREPMLNMSFPPLSWQTYDIEFRAPRWDACGNKIVDGRISVWHNGICIHDNYRLPTKTGAGKPEGPENQPLRLQFHGDAVHFRHVWLVSHPQPETIWPSVCPSLDSYPAGERRLLRRPRAVSARRGGLFAPRRGFR